MDDKTKLAMEKQDREHDRIKKRIAKTLAETASLRRMVDEIEQTWRDQVPEGVRRR